MNAKYVYDLYKSIFPFYADMTERYYPHKKDSIRVILKGGKSYIFSYTSKNGVSLKEHKEKEM